MSYLVSLLGIAGNLAFAVACVPTAWRTWRAGKSIGTPVGLAWNIFVACLLFYSYTAIQYVSDPLVYIGGAVEITCYAVVLWYHYFPSRKP